MLSKNTCIVLSRIKFKDNDLIVKCYTQNRGVISYVLKGVLTSKRGKSKAVYYQALSQLHIEEHYQANKTLHYIKDVKFSYVYKSLHTNIYKSAVTFFLADVLSSVLQEEEQNNRLFEFIENALKYFDIETHFANFHLYFLLQLTKYLGFYPDNTNNHLPYFDLQAGGFVASYNNSKCISHDNLIILKQLLGMHFDDLNSIKLNAKQRQEFSRMLLLYFSLHIEGFKTPKSFQVLIDIFN